MRRALQLASLGRGGTSPNPLVGAVVLDAAGQLVGEGFHKRAGSPHAEVVALRQAGERARDGTVVVTLEPCCHHGRTPPCCDAVIAAGLKRVVVAMADPDPRVCGEGVARLRRAGLEVIEGVARAEATQLNRAFVHRVHTGRPLGILKWAMSLDGRTALPNGESQWISSQNAREWVHHLRAACDAVIVGGGTVRADDPLLTSRGRRHPEPLRVVLSRGLNLPKAARLWDQDGAATLVAHGPEAPLDRRLWLDAIGVERLEMAVCEPASLLEALAQRGCNQVLWECGPELAAAALRQLCVQELAAVIAPKLLGGLPARTPLGELGLSRIESDPSWKEDTVRRLGVDLVWTLSRASPSGTHRDPPMP
ncbi:bifunctional diaminohydroxyphosphoribosylaminopyrimidine deaminase/5-amino-6-(5-phosphoribosylamino)uracil reductase RibD [Synechococcus sp. CCY 0621]|uniref:bifunctional diaminohydroxyphosphoribosylaminopyrimidine deaminase/5-amino-6-(5-phosphoribosylamino)uracil reductase RibD n=1 Tax=Synechococcus sp. CCY 0621 TaxID=2815603 RepID=UPI001C221CD5|nr:bifunctional diaminohydroxyphosphoribosylaminopyrimidine deaminase/5-amino-6-(5-phosphoribosylamino)uracil reductase RibD [Synechococcus sp. CCY 0621]